MPGDVLRSSTLTDQLAEEIRAALARVPAGGGRAVLSERTLAEVHGVSRTTVRRALRKLTAEGYLASRPRQGYHLAPAAARSGSKLIALVCTKAGDAREWTAFQATVLSGLQAAARTGNKDILLLGRDEGDPAALARHMLERGAAGAIVDCDDPQLAMALRQRGVPVVLIDAADPGVESVTQDNFGGAYLATSQLIAAGHQRVACVLLNPFPELKMVHYRERLGGYLAAMSEAGLSPRSEWLITSPAAASPGRALVELARGSEAPTAAVVLWSEVLTDVGEALRGAGLKMELCVWWGATPEARDGWRARFPGLAVPDGVAWDVGDLARRALERLESLLDDPMQPPARTLIPLRPVGGKDRA